jgi:hypothetical protein
MDRRIAEVDTGIHAAALARVASSISILSRI